MTISPEINIARRLVAIKKLSPPIDVRSLVSEFSDLREIAFPVGIDIDGVCLGLKRPGRMPVVVLNSGRSKVRQRFTLAHELGHILIPWHTGNVFDFTGGDIFDEEIEYRTMEAEANRFASELLMPSEWVLSLIGPNPNPIELVRKISAGADTSPMAALLKLVTCFPPGYAYVEICDGEIARTGRSPNTAANFPYPLSVSDVGGLFPWAAERWSGRTAGGQIFWWNLDVKALPPEDKAVLWRDVLAEIMAEMPSETDKKKFVNSLSGVIGISNGGLRGEGGAVQLKNLCLQRLYSRAQSSEEYSAFIKHPKFETFLDAKVIELLKKWNTDL